MKRSGRLNMHRILPVLSLRPIFCIIVALDLCSWMRVAATPVQSLPDVQRQAFLAQIEVLKQRSASLNVPADLRRYLPDVTCFVKAAEWALKFQEPLSPTDVESIRRALLRADTRLTDMEAGKVSWTTVRGRLALGYISRVDGSVQPFGVDIPASYTGRPTRLDVVLHGSSHPEGASEVRFLDGNPDNRAAAKDHDYIELYPLGRVENCYRWAGETDVFEAIADVCTRYNIDHSRIVLRGMSMGASGTWHLGLKHPDQFAALGPYCGYVDTHRFSETQGMNFIKVGPLPPVQELGLHMLDSIDYAANAGVVPAIAAIGDKDPFYQAHVLMHDAVKAEGLEMVNIISPGTAHVQDPTTWAEQMKRISAIVDRPRGGPPDHIRFVTWTLKYPKCYWITILGMDQQYHRAEIQAHVETNGTIVVDKLQNITKLSFQASNIHTDITKIRIGGKPVSVPDKYRVEGKVILSRYRTGWKASTARREAQRPQPVSNSGKAPGLQGPIDDAFCEPFLCVRGTGKPWSTAVQSWADANLRRFAYEWSRYFRGDIRVKDDVAVTPDDAARYNLILFGDPGSNLWIRKAVGVLPIKWSRTHIQSPAHFSDQPSSNIAPVLICVSPFSAACNKTHNRGALHYLVINSGHTFHESELGRLNYLLFPRLGDWALFKIGESQPDDVSAPLNETLITAGYFNESWR